MLRGGVQKDSRGCAHRSSCRHRLLFLARLSLQLGVWYYVQQHVLESCLTSLPQEASSGYLKGTTRESRGRTNLALIMFCLVALLISDTVPSASAYLHSGHRKSICFRQLPFTFSSSMKIFSKISSDKYIFLQNFSKNMLSHLCPANTVTISMIILMKLTCNCFSVLCPRFPYVLDDGNLCYSAALLVGQHLVSLE